MRRKPFYEGVCPHCHAEGVAEEGEELCTSCGACEDHCECEDPDFTSAELGIDPESEES